MRGLYAIVDVTTLEGHGLDPLRFGCAIAAAGPAALQVRNKRFDARATLELLRALRTPTRDHGVLLVANDRPDLAALAECDAVHLGQDDLPVPEARRVLAALHRPSTLVGMSVHDEHELTIALAEGPDYVAFGPVFGTAHKASPAPTLGLEGLSALGRRAREHLDVPQVAIGGIDLERAGAVRAHVACAAVIGALVVPDAVDPYAAATERARTLHAELGGAPR